MKSQLAIAMQLGFEFMGSMIAGLFLGYLAEQYFHISSTWSMGAGAFLGLFIWVLRALRMQKKISSP